MTTSPSEEHDHTEAVEVIRRGDHAASEGRERPLAEFFEAQRAEHNLPSEWTQEPAVTAGAPSADNQENEQGSGIEAPDRGETDAVWAAIPGAAPLREIFGHWPTLHDANIRSVAVDWESCSLTMVFDYNGLVTREPQERSETVRLALRWSGVRRLNMTAYGEDLYGVAFRYDGDDLETRFAPYAWGASGTIIARSVEVVSVERDFAWPEGDENHTVHFTAG